MRDNFIAISKSDLRRECLTRRDQIEDDMHRDFSRAAAQIATEYLGDHISDNIVSVFWPIRSEIDTRVLIALLSDAGAQLCLPVIMDRTTLLFRQWRDGDPLNHGRFGTREPEESAKIIEPQIMFIPFAAFDRGGGRIGYGAGYYDRVIAHFYQQELTPYLIGYGFACQEVPYIPVEPHDWPLDAIVTEEGLIESSARVFM